MEGAVRVSELVIVDPEKLLKMIVDDFLERIDSASRGGASSGAAPTAGATGTGRRLVVARVSREQRRTLAGAGYREAVSPESRLEA